MVRRKALPVIVLLSIMVLLAGCGPVVAGAAAPVPVTPTSPPTTGPPPANIPVYSSATLRGTQSAPLNAHQATTWAYTVSGPDVTLADVARFYEREMPPNGWAPVESVPPENGQGAAAATVLVYQQHSQARAPTPAPGQG